MTPELTARTVKACKVLGWPLMSLMPNDNDSWELVLSWDDENIDYEIEYALESHFRQWLKKHWDEVESHCTNGVVTLELVRYNPPGESCYCAEVVINTEGETDELELYLTAVERTLE